MGWWAMFETKPELARLAARIAAANGWAPEDVGGPVTEDGILAWEGAGRLPTPTHGTAADLVMAEVRAGRADSVPQGLLDLAGLTRDGNDAADYRVGRAMEAAGVPPEFRELPADLTRNAQLGAAEPRGLWLYGDVGRGKTSMACAVMRGWLSEHPHGTAAFTTEADLLGAMKRAFDMPGVDAELVLERYVACDLLVMDDMGKTRLSGWGVSQVFRVVDGRWGKRLPTVFTSQHSLPEWGALMGEASSATARAMVSRISGTCDQLAFGGRDRRMA